MVNLSTNQYAEKFDDDKSALIHHLFSPRIENVSLMPRDFPKANLLEHAALSPKDVISRGRNLS
jgi:hypothetical protein